MSVSFSNVVRSGIGISIMVAMGCGPVPDSSNNLSDNSIKHSCNTNLNIPQVVLGSSYEQWHLLISRSGTRVWNGQNVDNNTMRRYMMELSEMPTSAGKLTIHIQPGTPCEVIRDLRLTLDNSPLCLQGRCAQDRWDYERPIVN